MTDDAHAAEDDLLTATEAAAWAGVPRSTVQDWIAHGWLPAVRHAGRLRIRRAVGSPMK